MESATPSYRTSHIGLCISDLTRSLRFYVDGLGFTQIMAYEINEQIPEVDAPCSLTSTFLEKDGLRIELLHYHRPDPIGHPPTRRNHLGMTHLSFYTEDVEAAARSMLDFGADPLPETRMGLDDPHAVQILFVADPDGNRVEFMHAPAGAPW